MTEIWEQDIPEEYEKKIMKRIEWDKNSKLLDFGAGYGRYLDIFAKYFQLENLYGIEIDRKALKVLKEKGYNCYKSSYDCPNIPFDDNFFDYIYSSNVIEHIPKHQYNEYLQEFYRILKKGGILIIGTPNYPAKRFYDFFKAFKTKQFKYYFFDDPTHVNKLSYKKFKQDLKKIFPEVNLDPTYILLENQIKCIKKNRNKITIFADKIIAVCKK